MRSRIAAPTASIFGKTASDHLSSTSLAASSKTLASAPSTTSGQAWCEWPVSRMRPPPRKRPYAALRAPRSIGASTLLLLGLRERDGERGLHGGLLGRTAGPAHLEG